MSTKEDTVMFNIMNEQGKIIANTNGFSNVVRSRKSLFSNRLTIVATSANYSRYKKQERQYIKRINSLFD